MMIRSLALGLAVAALSVVALSAQALRVDASTAVTRHVLLIRERGHNHMCLSRIPEPPLGREQKRSDRFQLRAFRHGNRPNGRVLARAVKASWTPHHCGLNVTFKVRSNLGPFNFYDATTGDIWFKLRLSRLVDGRWERTAIAL